MPAARGEFILLVQFVLKNYHQHTIKCFLHQHLQHGCVGVPHRTLSCSRSQKQSRKYKPMLITLIFFPGCHCAFEDFCFDETVRFS